MKKTGAGHLIYTNSDRAGPTGMIYSTTAKGIGVQLPIKMRTYPYMSTENRGQKQWTHTRFSRRKKREYLILEIP